MSGIISAQGKLGYNYKKSWVSEENWQNSTVSVSDKNPEKIVLRRFEYNNNGHLIAEYNGNEKKRDYTVISDQRKTTLKINEPDHSARTVTMSYDSTFRPIETHSGDGTQIKWKYPRNGGSSIEFTDFEGAKTNITESADGTKRTIETPQQHTVTENYDQAGRLTHLKINDQTLIQQQWSPYGKLLSLETGICTLKPRYNDDGLTESITRMPPGPENQSKKWETINLDFAGRPVKITDYSGLQMAVQYDKKGALSQLVTERDGKNYGYRFFRNDKGQIDTVQSSWGSEQYIYDSTGDLSKLIIKKPGVENEQQAVVEFDSDRLNRVVQFDGGQMEISYCNDSLLNDLPSQIKCPNGLKLNYSYNTSANLNKVNIGDDRQVRLDYDNKGRIIGYSFCKK